ncbi:MAG: energy transducer TonB [Acidobacteriota bacterium]|nr:energy transducer TonB [Acidobacteriota bacterium]
MRATRLAILGAAAISIAAALWFGLKPRAEAASGSASLGLNVERSGRYLRVSWNRNQPLLWQSKHGVLSILEGAKEMRLGFDSNDLTSSTVLYEPSTGDVTVNLNVRDDRNRYVSESVRVDLKLKVDAAGNVTGASFESPPRSAFFARLAMEAVRQWKFTPGQTASHVVHFEFTNKQKRAYLK